MIHNVGYRKQHYYYYYNYHSPTYAGKDERSRAEHVQKCKAFLRLFCLAGGDWFVRFYKLKREEYAKNIYYKTIILPTAQTQGEKSTLYSVPS